MASSGPQNNLDDLRRKIAGGAMRPSSANGGNANKFKFKPAKPGSPATKATDAKATHLSSSTKNIHNKEKENVTPIVAFSSQRSSSLPHSSSSPLTAAIKRSSSGLSSEQEPKIKRPRTGLINIQNEKEPSITVETPKKAHPVYTGPPPELSRLRQSTPTAVNISRASNSPYPPTQANKKKSLTTTNTDLADKCPDELRLLLITNYANKDKTMEAIIDHYAGRSQGQDLFVLQSTKDLLEQRIQQIRDAIEESIRGGNTNFSDGAQVTTDTIHSLRSPLNSHHRTNSGASAMNYDHYESNSSSRTPSRPHSGFDTSTPLFEHNITDSVTTSNGRTSTSITLVEASSDDVVMLKSTTSSEAEEIIISNPPPKTSHSEPGVASRGLNDVKQTFRSAQSSSRAANEIDQTKSPYYKEAIRKLKEVFQLDDFRQNQLKAINATLDAKDAFVLMPTGGGKSLCYQLPAVCTGGKTKGLTVVVSPLIALMNDQVHHLQAKGIDVVSFNSDQGAEGARVSRARLTGSGKRPDILYVTPERLDKSTDLRSILGRLYKQRELARFVIDEAHCVSTWGRDFRDSYQSLKSLRLEYPGIPIMALTATANEQVMNDVIDQLGICGCEMIMQSFNRPNLFYDVRPKLKNVINDIASFIQLHKGQTGVIYCLSRNKCEEVAKELRDKYKLKAKHYHAQMSPEDKHKTQAAWQSGECEIIVATIAFGMGIDKADVRYVIHHSLPMSMDGYYQETGRAGRDGKDAKCILYYTYADTKILYKLIKDSEKTSEEEKERQLEGVRAVVKYCQNDVDCRRVQVLRYFGQGFDPRECHKACNNCLDEREQKTEDMTTAAKSLLNLVQALGRKERMTKVQCLDVFRGANVKTIRDKGYDSNPYFGAGAKLSREHAERLIDQLLVLDALREECFTNRSGWNNSYVQLGLAADNYLSKGEQILMTTKINAEKASKTKATRRKSQTVVAVAAVASTSKRGLDYYEDLEESTFEENTFDMEAETWDDADPIGDYDDFPDVRVAPDPPVLNSNKEPEDYEAILAAVSELESETDPAQRCYRSLKALREKIAKECHIESLEDILDDPTLELMSVTVPTDMHSMKALLQDCIGNDEEVEKKYQDFGRRFLSTCVTHKMEESSERVPSTLRTQRLDTAQLHEQFDFHA